MATLVVLQGPDKGKTFAIADECACIGRADGDVPLNDQTVSRRHADLRLVGGAWTITDLNSANGTYVNGVRVEKPVRLTRGDQIRLGSSLLVYTGSERSEQLSGASIPHDMVTLDAGAGTIDASIMASVPSSDDSLVLAAPETAYAVKAWKVIRELSDVTGNLLPLDRLLTRVMDIIFEEVAVDRGVLLLRSTETGRLTPEVVRFRNRPVGGDRDSNTIIASQTVINHVLDTNTGVLCSNIVADQRFGSERSAQNIGMRSVICAPIVAREIVLGVVHLDCPVTRHTYTEPELKLITAIGHQTGLAIDNTRLVQAHLRQERLAAAGEAVAYLSHYIRNILQGMRGGADILRRGLERQDLKHATQGWQVLERNLDRTYNLVLNMLAFSKPREPHFELLSVNQIATEVIELVQKQADDAKVVLLPDLADDVPPIPVDHDGLHQVILNLVTNAIDAVQPGTGIVNVRTLFDSHRREVHIIVKDNGPGIPRQHREKIFEPFHSTKGHGGTGLGLPVARKIVREMHGRLNLVDNTDGGAEFRVRLAAAQPVTPSPADTHGPADS